MTNLQVILIKLIRNICVLLFVLICFQTNGQNMIPNPSFENYSSCPTSHGQLSNATPWVNPNTNTPDFFNSCVGSNCSFTPYVCVPSNWVGNQLPNTGNGYAGIFVGAGDNNREYMQVQLLSPLVTGMNYQFSYYISLGDNYDRAIDRIGAYFSSTPVSGANQLSNTPQITTPCGLFITDKIGWVLITDTFTASGGEEYITLGNFNDESNTNSISGLGGPLQYSHYYIDDLSLIEIGCTLPTISLGINTSLCEGETLTLDATTSNAVYLWQDNSTNSTFNVSQQGTYWVQVTNNCGSSFDTIIVNYTPLPSVSVASCNPGTLCENGSFITLPIGFPAGGNYSGNGVVGGFFDPSIAGVAGHNIIYTYADGNSCTNSDTTGIKVEICTGINDISTDFGINIYPNPNTGQFIINKPNDLNKEVHIKLLDITSRLILEKVIPTGKKNVTIDIRNYSNGMYYLYLIVDDEQLVKQIIKK